MKLLKLSSLILATAAALMALAGPAAAAPTLTSPAGTEYTGTVTMTASESLLLKAGFSTITCTESTMSLKVETNNEERAAGKRSTLSFGNCGGGTYTVHVLRLGSTVIHHVTGTVTEIEDEVTFADPALGISCVYGGGAGVDIGRLVSGTTATLPVKAQLPKISGGFACASPAEWTGKYTVTTPDTLLVD